MKNPGNEFMVVRATEYFRDVERELRDLNSLYLRVCQSIDSLCKEFRATVKKSSLVLYPRYRSGNPLPTGVYWARACRRRPKVGEPQLPRPSARRRWVKYRKGAPTHDQIYLEARDVGSKDLFGEYSRRATALNQACRELTHARQSLEQRLVARRERRSWEANDLAHPAPQVAIDLPDTSKVALGSAWRILLRMAATQFEMAAIADRHNAAPPYPGLRLRFERDATHRYGRYLWIFNSKRLHGQAKALARNKRRIVDKASLPDRAMRELGIPAASRRAITPHETQRRTIAGHHRVYIALLGCLRKRAGEARALVWRLLRRAEPGEAAAS
jgi:hypothetical protein